MAQRYNQGRMPIGEAHFSASPESGLEFSTMTAVSRHLTTLNAGSIVPIYCKEILPSEELSMNIDAVIRELTLQVPVMGQLYADFYAFFVPNRVVNHSWKEVQGENSALSWANVEDIVLAPLLAESSLDGVSDFQQGSIQIPAGSVGDYYGLPTQQPLSYEILNQMNDLVFRGYLEIYNEYFRDQNYQPPITYSKLNVFEGFLSIEPNGSFGGKAGDALGIAPDGYVWTDNPNTISYPLGGRDGTEAGIVSDGQYPDGALVKGVYGDGAVYGPAASAGVADLAGDFEIGLRFNGSSAQNIVTAPPLKANKLHDYFTSVLPAPQKGVALSIMFPSESKIVPLTTTDTLTDLGLPIKFGGTVPLTTNNYYFGISNQDRGDFNVEGKTMNVTGFMGDYETQVPGSADLITKTNLASTFPIGSVGTIDINDLRTVIATQQLYELMARSGTRYREFVRALFGVDVDDPYRDIPRYLGHIRRELKNYQVAQTSASAEGSTAQGNLTAYGYTADGGHLFSFKALEHGYVHVFLVIRHKNVYPAYVDKTFFRRTQLDYYNPLLANISEQPVYLREINPFASEANTKVFGYQEAWADYRYEPDRVSALMRPGVAQNLAVWNMADDFNSELTVADASFMQSNSQEIVGRSLAVDDTQFLAQITFSCTKKLPMPTYSVPGLDVV